MAMTSPYARYPSLADRVVLVSGGATGIGAAFVGHFARQGARVGFLDIDDAGAAELLPTLADVQHLPLFVHCDVTDVAALQDAIATIAGQLGPVTVLVNNAANDVRHHLPDVDLAAYEQSLAINLRHQVFATRAVAPGMEAAGGGAIICLGSTGWMKKNADYPLYATAKAAVHGFVNGMAHTLGQRNIRINALVPGWVITDKQRRLWLDADGKAEIARVQCMRGYLMADDIARMALFLASDDGHMCTGQSFVVDGGWV